MAKKQKKHAISPQRQEDYPQWYQVVVKEAEMAEMAHVRGCMVIKPWGYGIWELLQHQLDTRFKETGHDNAYFPIFIPLSYIEKEAAHVEGFAKEMAVVTHHRVAVKDGKLVPSAKLEEPLILRPTSETIIGASFASWIKSYRDLPLLINQWCNTIRWEMRPRIFLRTTEFLWQEGHTAHASEQEAIEETMQMLEIYRSFSEEVMAIPVIVGEKSEGERFPGAVKTFCIEAMMQDRKALQAGTSHYLGQNFAKASEIKFINSKGEEEYVYTTSWGVSTRLIGALIMTHGDDDGLRLPPRVAPKQVVIIPILRGQDEDSEVQEYCQSLRQSLQEQIYRDEKVRVLFDSKDIRSIDKKWQWIKKGVPLILEIGPRDVKNDAVTVIRRDQLDQPTAMPKQEFVARIASIFDEIQSGYLESARAFMNSNINREISDFEEFRRWFSEEQPGQGGFVLAKWSEDMEMEKKLAEMKVSIRCLPLVQSGTSGKCVITGQPATTDAIFAKSY